MEKRIEQLREEKDFLQYTNLLREIAKTYVVMIVACDTPWWYCFTKEMTRARIRELGQQFSLDEVLYRKAGKLSGGWQRRVSIAMALISQPRILFLDEPTLGLDVIAKHELWEVIRSLKGKITIILTTHYMEEAEALSDRIGIMKSGRLLAVGTAGELKEQAGCADFESAFVAIVKEAQ